MTATLIQKTPLPARGPVKPGTRLRFRIATADGLLLAIVSVLAFAWIYFGSILIGVLFASAFLALSFRRLDLALAFVFSATPFQNDLSEGLGIRFSVAEFSLYLILAVVLLRSARLPSVGPIFFPICLYLAACAVSSITDLRGTTLTSLVQMVQYMLVAVAVYAVSFKASPQRLLVCFDALVLVGVLMALCGLATHFEFMGLHKNGWGASVAGQLIVAVELWFATAQTRRRRRRLAWAVGILAITLLLTLSRGGWIAAAVGCGTITLVRRQFKLAARAVLLLLPLLVIAWFSLPQESRDYAVGFDAQKHWNIEARYKSIDYALTAFRSSPLLGVGVGLRKEYDATNIVLMTMAETGVLGLATFLLIHATAIWMTLRIERSVSRTAPEFSLVCLGLALILARFGHGLVDHYWSRGPILSAWAAFGMTTTMYLIVRKGPRGVQ